MSEFTSMELDDGEKIIVGFGKKNDLGRMRKAWPGGCVKRHMDDPHVYDNFVAISSLGRVDFTVYFVMQT